jgi:hypothetical protein
MQHWLYTSQIILVTIVRYPVLRIMGGVHLRDCVIAKPSTCWRLLMFLTCWGPRALVCYPKIPRGQTVHRCWSQHLRRSGCVHGDCAWLYHSWSRRELNSTLWSSYLEKREKERRYESRSHSISLAFCRTRTYTLAYSTHTCTCTYTQCGDNSTWTTPTHLSGYHD